MYLVKQPTGRCESQQNDQTPKFRRQARQNLRRWPTQSQAWQVRNPRTSEA
jgi:hypothetical protein